MTPELRIDGSARVDGEPRRDETIVVELPVEIRSDGPVGLTLEEPDRGLGERLLGE